MARFLLRWPIGMLFCFVGQAFGFLRLEPTTVYKDFGQKLAFNQTFVAEADGDALAVCTSRVFSHDRLPFPGSQAKCDGKSMQIVALFEMEEGYVIGCCKPVENRTRIACSGARCLPCTTQTLSWPSSPTTFGPSTTPWTTKSGTVGSKRSSTRTGTVWTA